MNSKKKKDARKSGGGGKGKALMEQMGMFPGMMMGDNVGLDDDDSDDDDDLEAELRALQGESSPKKSKAQSKKAVDVKDLDKMLAASMREDDGDVSDTEDPDLLAELEDLTTEDMPPPPKPSTVVSAPVAVAPDASQSALIEERLRMYVAGEANAKAAGESSKARRLGRGTKTLQDLLKKAKAGTPIDEDDIPPAVSSGSSTSSSEKTSPDGEQLPPQTTKSEPKSAQPAQTTNTAPSFQQHQKPPVQSRTSQPPQSLYEPTTRKAAAVPTTLEPPEPRARQASPSGTSSEDGQKRTLSLRKDQYKAAALAAKHAGDNMTAVKYMKTAKQFDQVIEALEQGKPVDLTHMPPPPPEHNRLAGSSQAPTVTKPLTAPTPSPPEEVPELSDQDKKKLFNAPETAGSALEALEQRLAKYKASQDEATEQGNSSKAKRMGRITKQYQDAIKMYKAGKPVDLEELPCPPGFPPIPNAAKTPAATPTGPPAGYQGASASAAPAMSQKAPAPQVPSTVPRTAAPGPPPTQKPKINRQLSAMSRAEQQTIFLQERQLQFKKAALEAKTNQDMELAKKYLRFAKGFDQMIEASRSGLPVDMSKVPPPPHTDDEHFEFVDAEQCSGDRDEMYKKLEQDLVRQIKSCSANADNFTHLGDVSSATKFDKMGQDCRKDLDTLKNAYKHGDPVPRFHYENRQFSMVKCCTDLGDNDLEIHILRGTNYGLPSGYAVKDLDTYVKYEFPYPNDDPQTGQTDVCKHTNMPEYDQTFKVQINRKSRGFLRLLKSNKQVKLDVYYKRGFLKGDKLIGTVQVKLQSLENAAIVHESVDLMDGRKAAGGKLEFKLRVRDPFVSKQVEEIKEKWLVIDKFERSVKPQPAPAPSTKRPAPTKPPQGQAERPTQGRPPPSTDYTSIEVLKYEKQLTEQQIRKYQGRLNRADESSLQHKVELIQRQIDDMKKRLQTGGATAYKEYARAIEQSQSSYVQEAKALVLQGNREKAQIILNKKKMIEREVDAIRSKFGS